MPIFLFHGNGTSALNSKVLALKKGFDNLSIKELNGKNLSWEQVRLELLSGGLFTEKRLIILEDVPNINFDELPNDQDLTLILKFSKPLIASSIILKEAQKRKIQVTNFPEEKETSVFPLLDLLAEKNPKALKELDKIYQEYGGQYILTMIFYLLRKFVLVPKNLPSFVLKKYQNQKKNFPPERVRELYRETLETDFKIKSGNLEEKIGLHLLAERFLA